MNKTLILLKCRLLLIVSMLVCAVNAYADSLPGPAGEVLLTISGKIKKSNSSDSSGQPLAKLDMSILESFEKTTIETNNPWVEKPTVFEGVRISDLLEFVGAETATFKANAIDGYTADLEKIDFERYPIIVAYKSGGEYMSVRNLGPLWIIYPFDDFPELVNEYASATSVWQLIEMVVY